MPPSQQPPIACSLAATPGDFAARMEEFRRLFTRSLAGRSRLPAGVRFRFHDGPGVADWVRDLARRESECCPFFSFRVSARDGEVWWDTTAADTPDTAARELLDEFYRLPGTLGAADS